MTETWKLNEYGGINCECGNSVIGDGFEPCLANGEIVEPTLDSGWDDLYKCKSCEKIANIPMDWAG